MLLLNLKIKFQLRKKVKKYGNMECPNKNKFCVLCGLFVPKNKSRNVTTTFLKKYEEYFFINFPQNFWYVPTVACEYCYRCMNGLTQDAKNRHRMKYVYPVVWLHRSEHAADSCYFCQANPYTTRIKYESRCKIPYKSCESVKPAVLRSASNPNAPSEECIQIPEAFERESHVESISEFLPTESEVDFKTPHLITQSDFNDLVRDTDLSQRKAEILASRLKQWGLVSQDFLVTSGRKRSKQSLSECFLLNDQTGITYAADIEQLFETIGHPYIPDEWRLFIDDSVKSLKGVLLHIGNKYPSVPVIYGIDVAENYNNINAILQLINYDKHQWVICSDLKIVAIVMGLKKGFSKHQCFLCLWEGRCRNLHYTNHIWQSRLSHQIGSDSIEHTPLVPSSKIILPPLHIKLGLIRNFVRALDSEGTAMEYLKMVFPKLSTAKIVAGMLYYSNNYLCSNLIIP